MAGEKLKQILPLIIAILSHILILAKSLVRFPLGSDHSKEMLYNVSKSSLTLRLVLSLDGFVSGIPQSSI